MSETMGDYSKHTEQNKPSVFTLAMHNLIPSKTQSFLCAHYVNIALSLKKMTDSG